MRSHLVIRAELETARADYQSKADKLPAPQLRPMTDRIRALMEELSDSMSPGAEKCEGCGRKPVGLRHIHARKGPMGEDGVAQFWLSHQFEVGCPACGNKRGVAGTPEELSGPDLDQYADATIARAVQRWNDEKYLPAKTAPGPTMKVSKQA